MAVLNDLIVQGATRLIGDAIGNKYIVNGGASSQFMKADGSLNVGQLDHYLTNVSGTAGSSTDRTRLSGTAESVTSLYDGLRVTIKIPVAGTGGGLSLNVNGLGEHPLVHNVNSKLTSHYGVGTILSLVYDSAQAATITVNGTNTSFTGCWKLRLYDSNDNDSDRVYYTRYSGTTQVTPYKILFTKNDTTVLPSSSASTTAGTKVITTDSFDPFGQIYYYASGTTAAAGAILPASSLYVRYSLIDLRYSFNTLSTLVANRAVYVVAKKQSDGSVKLDTTNPISQTLPTTDDGKIYITLGYAYDNYRISFNDHHPAYYYALGELRLFTNEMFNSVSETISAALNDLNDKVGDVERLLSTI